MGDEGQKPTVGGDAWSAISEFYPYGDHPPRLCAALNDTPTDTREVVQFAKVKNTHTAQQKKTADAEGKELDVPQRDVFSPDDIESGEPIVQITKWIENRLTLSGFFNWSWLSQIGPIQKWAPNGTPEDQWAMALPELFLGVTYAGIGPAHGFGSPLQRDAEGELKPMVSAPVFRGSAYNLWEPYVFSRIERDRIVYEKDPYDVMSWEDPVAPSADKVETNTDPAVPISVACQHMSTYTVLTRGFPLASLGDGTTACSALMASDSCKGLALYAARKTDSYVHKKTGIEWDGSPGTYLLPTKDLLNVEAAVAAGMGPGSIVTYDPDHGSKFDEVVFLNKYEQEIHGSDPVKIFGAFYKSRSTVESSGVKFNNWTDPARSSERLWAISTASAKLTTLEAKDPKLPQDQKKIDDLKAQIQHLESKASLDTIPRTERFESPKGRQYDGSHIYAILRVSPDKKSVQLMDVNQKGNLGALKETNSDTLIAYQGGAGIVDGALGWTSLYNDNNGFAGIGVLPEHTISADQVAFMKKARPVGLCRLVLTKRLPEEGKKARQMDHNDVLYVSKMSRMYGNSPDENHYVSHLLWSLRNTPGFTNIQPWFCIFIPLGLLAKCMWAHGARSMSLADFVAKHRTKEGTLTGLDYQFNIMITNEGRPPRAGQVELFAQSRTRPEGAKTITEWMPSKPPGPIYSKVNPEMVLIPQEAKRSLAWDQSFVHPSIELDESSLPARFKDGG